MSNNSYSIEPPEPQRTEILLKLIAEVKQTGGAVWCEGNHPSIRYFTYGDPEYISWHDAAILTGVEITWEKQSTMRRQVREKIQTVKSKIIARKPMRTATSLSDAEMDRKAEAMLTEQRQENYTIGYEDAWRKKA